MWIDDVLDEVESNVHELVGKKDDTDEGHQSSKSKEDKDKDEQLASEFFTSRVAPGLVYPKLEVESAKESRVVLRQIHGRNANGFSAFCSLGAHSQTWRLSRPKRKAYNLRSQQRHGARFTVGYIYNQM